MAMLMVVNSMPFTALASSDSSLTSGTVKVGPLVPSSDEAEPTVTPTPSKAWKMGDWIKAGETRTYKNKEYRCVVSHSAFFVPSISIFFWRSARKSGDTWSKPDGEVDNYQVGETVEYDGKLWVSDEADNEAKPGDAGWTEVTGDDNVDDTTDDTTDDVVPTDVGSGSSNRSDGSPWIVDEDVKAGDIREYNGIEYRCDQDHTTQAGWEPNNTPALWTVVHNDWDPWVLPTHNENAYDEGAKVTHAGKKWISDYSANVWEPGVFGWSSASGEGESDDVVVDDVDTFGVTYNVNELPEGFELPTDPNAYKEADTVQVAAVPEIDGYVFDGWLYDGQVVTEFNMPANNVILAGVFIPSGTDMADLTALPLQYNVRYYDDASMSDDNLVYEEAVIENTLAVGPSANPTSDAGRFVGWYTEQGDAFHPGRNVITEDMNLIARFNDNQFQVVFLNADSRSEMKTLTVEKGNAIESDEFPTPDHDIDKTFIGWVIDGTNETFEKSTIVEQDYVLSPVLVSNATLMFITNGSEVDSQAGPEGVFVPTKPANPTRVGYDFAYWATSQIDEYDETQPGEYSFDQAITGTVVVYAVWKPTKVDYILNYWVEKYNTVSPQNPITSNSTSDYDLIYTKVMNAQSGDNLNGAVAGSVLTFTQDDVAFLNSNYTSSDAAKNVLNYADFAHSTTVTVSGQGTTTIDVFYNLIEFEFRFNPAPVKLNAKAVATDYMIALKNGDVYTGEAGKSYTYSAKLKLGQDITEIWPVEAKCTNDAETRVFINWSSFHGLAAITVSREYINAAMYGSGLYARSGRVDENKRIGTIQVVYNKGKYFEKRYYFTEVLDQEAAAGYATSVTGPYVNWKGIVYEFARSSKESAQTSDPMKYAKGWPGTSIAGFESILNSTEKNTPFISTNYQKVYSVDDTNAMYENLANDPHNINAIHYFMPRKSFDLTLNLGTGRFADDADLSGYQQAGSNAVYKNSFRYEETISIPTAEPQINGSVFEGWYWDRYFTQKYDGSDMTMPSNAMVLYARYVGVDHAITYYQDEAKSSTLATVTYNNGELIGSIWSDSTYQNGSNVGDNGILSGWYYRVNGMPVMLSEDMPVMRSYDVFPKWQDKPYVVTYVDNLTTGNTGTAEVASYQINPGNKNTLAQHYYYQPEAPSNPGYVFAGWYTMGVSDKMQKFTTGTRVNKDLLVFAVWGIELKYQSSNAKAGTVTVSSEIVTPTVANENRILPSPSGSVAIENPGYTFVNWTCKNDSSFAAIDDENLINVKQNDGMYVPATYIANFVENSNVEYNYVVVTDKQAGETKGGSVSRSTESIAPATGTPKGATATANDGYTFVGWTSDVEGTASVNAAALMTPARTNNLYTGATYYAQFESIPYKVTYELDENGAAPSGFSAPVDDETYIVNDTVTVKSAQSFAGYEFKGWFYGTEAVTSFDMPASDVTLKALYAEMDAVEIQYVVATNGSAANTLGGTVSNQISIVKPVTEEVASSTAAANAGYEFVQWTSDEAGNISVSNNAMLTPERKDGLNVGATYYAQFVAIDYTVTYELSGGVNPEGYVVPQDPNTYNVTEDVTVREVPEITGYEFTGWFYDGNDVGNFAMPADHVVLTGTFAEKAPVEIEYVAVTINGENGGTVSLGSESVSPVTGDPQGSIATAEAGYKFIGWSLSADEGTSLTTEEKLVPGRNNGVYESATYYAQFVEEDVVAIVYEVVTVGGKENKIGGSLVGSNEILAPATGIAQGARAQAADGYEFIGWKTSIDDADVFSTDAHLTPARVGGLNVDGTYYALFSAIPYRVTYELATDVVSADYILPEDDNTYYVSDSVDVEDIPNIAGYEFVGWNDGTEKVEETFEMPASDVVLKGEFMAINYRVTYELATNVVPAGYTVPEDENTYIVASDVTLKDIPNIDGYEFSGWKIGSADADATFKMPAEDVVITGEFTAIPYRVTYELTTAVKPAGYEVPKNDATYHVTDSVNMEAAPNYDGYVFTGWLYNDNEVGDTFVMPVGDVAFKGSFEAIDYTVSYELTSDVKPADYDLPQSEIYHVTDGVTLATVPEIEGYTFNGWRRDGATAYDFEMPAGDVTLTGEFTAIPYGVTYEVDGKIPADYVAQMDNKTYYVTDDVTLLAAPNFPGYRFDGWLMDGALTGDFKMPAKNVTLKGTFTAIDYTVTYRVSGDIPSGYLPPASETYNVFNNVTVQAAPSHEGYAFSGWKYNNFAASAFNMPARDVVIEGKFEKITMYVTYELQEGSARPEGYILPVDTNAYYVTNPVKIMEQENVPGYKFTGWFHGNDIVKSFEMRGKNETFTGKFEAIPYTVQYSVNGDVPAGYKAPENDNNYYVTDTLPIEDAPSIPGYTFNGWMYKGNAATTSMVMPPEDVTLVGMFTQLGNVAVNYRAVTGGVVDDQSGGTLSLSGESLEPATGIATGSLATANAGYAFLGWTSDEAGENLVKEDAMLVPDREGGLNVGATYYAQFAELENVAINYVAVTKNGTDGGSVTSLSESVAPATGTAIGSSADAAIGYKFVGWTSDEDGDVTLSNDVTFAPEKVNGLNVSATYYAQFVENDKVVVTYVVVTDGNAQNNAGGNLSRGREDLAPATGDALGSEATAEDGYTFIGWKTDLADEGFHSTDMLLTPNRVGGLNVDGNYYAM
ncbi:InlB B-repeat-containing protein, partial [Eubacteriales bacterium OttesenSCG-928-N13]|nr:InlB B-repeat-containing protein [Eubacteriales bacterium OttesenSCG-928-N13]